MENSVTMKPSVEEIMAWIQNKLETYGQTKNKCISSRRGDTFYINKHVIKNFNSNLWELMRVDTSFRIGLKHDYERITTELYSIDSSKLTTEVCLQETAKKEEIATADGDTSKFIIESYSRITLSSMPNENAIIRKSSHIIVNGKESKNDTEPMTQASIMIDINDKNMAERITKAFHDAIELCGGKPELY